MHVPLFMLRHNVTVETVTGTGGRGETYAAPATVRALVREKVTRTRDPEGAVVSERGTVLAVRLSEASRFTTGSRVTLPNGRVTRVLETARADDADLGAWQHLEIHCE